MANTAGSVPTCVTLAPNGPSNQSECQRRCLQWRCCPIMLIFLSFVPIFAGISNIAIGATFGSNLSESFHESFPEIRQDNSRQTNAGIGVLCLGIVLLACGIGWACYMKRATSDGRVVVYGPGGNTPSTVLTTNYGPQQTSFTTVHQPPPVEGYGSTNTYVYPVQMMPSAPPAEGGVTRGAYPANHPQPGNALGMLQSGQCAGQPAVWDAQSTNLGNQVAENHFPPPPSYDQVHKTDEL